MPGASLKILGYAVILGSALLTNTEAKAGQVTWYDPTGVMSQTGVGACGTQLNEDMAIAALAHEYFDSYPGATGDPNENPLCGKAVRVTIGSKSTVVTIQDRCHDCSSPYNIDLSRSSFQEIADLDAGRLDGTWEFVDPADDIGMDAGVGARSDPHGADGVPLNNDEDTLDADAAQRRSSTVVGTRKMRRVMRRLRKEVTHKR